MLKYLGKRLLQMIPVLLGATFLIYALVFLMPGDPVAAMFGDKPVDPSIAAQIRSDYNLDKPFIVQYLLFLKGIFTLDFGKTFSHELVIDKIARVYPVTINLALMAFAFEAVFGVIFGVIAGLKRGKAFDSTVLVLSLVLIAVPTFVMGFVLQFVVGLNHLGLKNTPINGYVLWPPATAGSNPGFLDLLLPAIVLGGVSLAYVIRLTRMSVSENMTADYVKTARAKGLSNSRVTVVHILRNSLIPVVTFLGADLGALMGGAIVTERVFNVNGIGNALYQAINKGDSTLIVSIVTILVLIFIVSNLIVDLLYAVLDPRIRYA
jgi:oligopeptide transport system permease protein